MKQPKYKFGDKFTKEVTTTVQGNRFKLKIVGYVTAISVISGSSRDTVGHKYSYEIRASVPSSYTSGEVICGSILEQDLDKEWLHEVTV